MNYQDKCNGQVLRVKGSLCITDIESDLYDEDGNLVYEGSDLEVHLLLPTGETCCLGALAADGTIIDVKIRENPEGMRLHVITVATNDEIEIVPEFLTNTRLGMEW